ncbi:MAG: protocatechuate 3,4-dioxygenase [Alphaproteobacteria bacterium]
MRPSRRDLFIGMTASLVGARAGFAAVATPPATEGPFYPPQWPKDHDADLVRVEAAVREAGGEILSLRGSVTEIDASPASGAAVEIWQCDANGIYLHPRDPRVRGRDVAFQGFGRVSADRDGRFAFRTILPVPYPGRTPHIHVRVLRGETLRLTTQLYIRDFPQNARDSQFRLLSAAERDLVSMVPVAAPPAAAAQWESEVRIVLPPV